MAHKAWLLVADGGKARFFERQLPLGDLIQIASIDAPIDASIDHEKDRPGRVFESGTTAHHAYEKHSDWHEEQKEVFILSLAGYLNEHRSSFDELYLCCPPKSLGLLRKHLSDQISSKVTREYAKD